MFLGQSWTMSLIHMLKNAEDLLQTGKLSTKPNAHHIFLEVNHGNLFWWMGWQWVCLCFACTRTMVTKAQNLHIANFLRINKKIQT